MNRSSNASMLPTYLLGCPRTMTMVLSGDSADEVFAGYERYLVMKYAGYLNPVRALFRCHCCCRIQATYRNDRTPFLGYRNRTVIKLRLTVYNI